MRYPRIVGYVAAPAPGSPDADTLAVNWGEIGLEASASIEIAKHALLSGGIILAVGMVAGLLAQKIKVPDVAVFLIAGMAIGPAGLGLIDILADSPLNQIILLFG